MEDGPVASTSKKRSKRKVWKKNRGKQKANMDATEPEVDLLSIRVEEPPPAPLTTTAGSPMSATLQESFDKPRNEDDHGSGDRLELKADSTADSTLVSDRSGSQITDENDAMKDILDVADEHKYEIEIQAGLAAASSRPILEWGLCGEDDRGPPVRGPPRTPPPREPRVKNKGQGQGQGREQRSSPGDHQLNQSHSPREPWKRRPLETRGRHEQMRSSSVTQPQSPTACTIEAHRLEGLSEWNRIKAMQHSAAAKVASHKNWVPREGIHRGGEGGEHNKGRGKAKQDHGEQNSQYNHSNHIELARQKFDADMRIKLEELLRRSKQTLKAEFQKAKRTEASRKDRDDLELELERNLVYCDVVKPSLKSFQCWRCWNGVDMEAWKKKSENQPVLKSTDFRNMSSDEFEKTSIVDPMHNIRAASRRRILVDDEVIVCAPEKEVNGRFFKSGWHVHRLLSFLLDVSSPFYHISGFALCSPVTTGPRHSLAFSRGLSLYK